MLKCSALICFKPVHEQTTLNIVHWPAAACRLFGFQTARLSFRLILRRMRQRPLVLENLSKIAAVNPPPHPGNG
jgi:hypothetical protein